ncbi:hypothetical protein [Brumimicrobium mesophilum]|uniref:hypothetical protein n=1 Tax=Brumimicrobium mesophilum TaxID=392717 RepID=UPI000D13EEB9|nr:hypothetical protein [Brumimicrobium mesophilum]
MRTNKVIIAVFSFSMLMACQKEGCTDQAADNYDSKAQNDDGSCIYNGVNPGDTSSGNLPIQLSGTETSGRTIVDQSTNPNLADYYIDDGWNLDAAIIIEPGVRIEMRSGARILVKSNGSLDATGLANNKIEFIGAQNVNGLWYNIEFESNNPNNKLIHCNISNGSKYYSSTPSMVVVGTNSQVTIQNSNFSNGSEFGLMTEGVSSKLPNFSNNNFSSFSKAPIRLESLSHADYLDNSTTISNNNTVPKIYIYNGNVESNTTVRKLNVPYSIRESISFDDSHTIVEAGVEMRIAADVRLEVKSNGSLEFAGTPSEPVNVLGEVNSKGYWYNLEFNSNNPLNRLNNTNVSGGRQYYSSQPGAIRLEGNALLNMTNSTVSNSPSVAIGGDSGATLNDNGGNSWSDCDDGGGLLP